jgi:RHS repeat-associated protein
LFAGDFEKQFFDNAVAYNNGSGTPTERLVYSYDAFGRIVQQQHIRPTVTDTYTTTYDAQGRVTQETTPTGTIQYQYDVLGRKTQCRTVVSTVPTDILTEITYTYDLFGRLSTVNTVRRDGALVDSNGAAPGTPPESTTYFYDLLGRPDYTLLPNGVIEDYTFDAMDRMDLMAHRRASDNAVLASYDYTYRADGKRTGLNESFSTTTARSNSYTWSYDNAGRLISEVLDSSDNSVDQTESYVYDLVGNRMRKEVNKPATAYVDQVFAYNYDANDRITSETLDNGVNGAGVDQTTTYGWTQTLQTSKTVSVPSVSSVVQSMSYGLGGQLERVVTTTQNGSGTVTGRTRVDYRYTPQGIRTISVDWTDANLDGTFAAGERTGSVEYLIENANFTGYQQTILEVTKNAAGQATKRTSYTFGVDEITQTTTLPLPGGGEGWGEGETLTFGHDGKGSVRALFGAAAAIAQVFTYSAYGELLAIHNGAGTLQPLTSSLTSVLYNGEGLDARTGLYNMRARWYSASNARWERLDPFNGNPNDPFSFNKYGFVHGDPVQGIDPTGMFFGIAGFFSTISVQNNTRASSNASSLAAGNSAKGTLNLYKLLIRAQRLLEDLQDVAEFIRDVIDFLELDPSDIAKLAMSFVPLSSYASSVRGASPSVPLPYYRPPDIELPRKVQNKIKDLTDWLGRSNLLQEVIGEIGLAVVSLGLGFEHKFLRVNSVHGPDQIVYHPKLDLWGIFEAKGGTGRLARGRRAASYGDEMSGRWITHHLQTLRRKDTGLDSAIEAKQNMLAAVVRVQSRRNELSLRVGFQVYESNRPGVQQKYGIDNWRGFY